MFQAVKARLKRVRNLYRAGAAFEANPFVEEARKLTKLELEKQGNRTQILNFLLGTIDRPEKRYLEIGVRNPASNFDHIQATFKRSVDPGVEFKANPVDFPMTSDAFFDAMRAGSALTPDTRFDVIFVDGLHLADQCWRDILNALQFISEDGYVVLHDCNPPTQWHAREGFQCNATPAGDQWNGTTWKAYYKSRSLPGVQSCCVDTDYGVGVLCRHRPLGQAAGDDNPFFEYEVMRDNRHDALNLLSYDAFKKLIASGQSSASS